MTAPHDNPEDQGGYGSSRGAADSPPDAGWGGGAQGYGAALRGYSQPPGYGAAPQGYGPPPGYGPGGYVQQPQTESQAIVVLVLGIASFVIFPVIPAIVALCLAPGARRGIEASNGWKTGKGMITGGVVAAWVNIALAVLAVLGILLFAVSVGGETSFVGPAGVVVPS